MNPDSRVAIEYARLRGEAEAQEIALVARWREVVQMETGERPTCDHKTALALIDMAMRVGRM